MDKVKVIERLRGEIEEVKRREREAAATVTDLHARVRQLETVSDIIIVVHIYTVQSRFDKGSV